MEDANNLHSDNGGTAIQARFIDFCKTGLSLDEDTFTQAMRLFNDSNHLLFTNMSAIGSGSPEEMERSWFAFVLYSVKRLTDKNEDSSTQGTNENGVTLSQILRVAKLNIVDFFKELPQFIVKVGPTLSNLYGADWEKRLEAKELQTNFVHLRLLSKYYKRTYLEFFLASDANDGKQSSGASTSGYVTDYHRFGWLLFLALRVHAFSRFKDLVTCTNGLVSIMAILIIHVPVRFRNFNINDSTRFVTKSDRGVDLLASLCSIYETSEEELKKTMEKANKLIAEILKKKSCLASECTSENLKNIDKDGLIYFEDLMEEPSLSSSLDILEKDYDEAIRNKAELDERVFANEEDSLLGSGSLSGGAMNIIGAKRKIDSIYSPAKTISSPLSPHRSPLVSHANGISGGANSKMAATPVTTAMTTAKWLRTVISPLPSKPSAFLERFLSSCDRDVTSDVIRRAHIILEAIFPSTALGERCVTAGLQSANLMDNMWAEQRRLEALKLYFRVLEAMCTAEAHILHGNNLTSLLTNERFHRCMLACSAELVLATHKTVTMLFPAVLERTGITAFDLSKVIESFIRHEESLPRELRRHLNSLEERLLESMVWEKSSSMYNSLIVARPALSSEINRLGLLAEPMPSLDAISMLNNISSGGLPPIPSLQKHETSSGQNGDIRSPKRICTDYRSVLVERNSFTSPVKDRLLALNNLKSKLLPPPLQSAFASPTRPIPGGGGETCAETGINIFFSKDPVSGKVIAKGPKVGRLFPLSIATPRILKSLFSDVSSSNSIFRLWHRRLGHPNAAKLSFMLNSGVLSNKSGVLSNKSGGSLHNVTYDCESCKMGKSKILPFPTHKDITTSAFDLIHTDVWGIAPVASHSHHKYFVTFIDDFSRHTWIYFLYSKSEVFEVFKSFLALIENQFSKTIKILRSDSGGEYLSNALQQFLRSKGIISQRSCLYTPQQNGVAERKNRHLLDVTRTLLLESSVPSSFWVEAISTAVHIINRLPSTKLENQSPYFRLFRDTPSYRHLHSFGCVCFVHLPPQERHKLSAQSVKCVFLGYAQNQKGFLCYDPAVRRIRVSRNVIFLEKQFFFQLEKSSMPMPECSNSFLYNFDDSSKITRFKPGFVYTRRGNNRSTNTAPNRDLAPEPDLHSLDLASTPDLHNPDLSLRRSTRSSNPPDRYGFPNKSLVATLSSITIPNSYSQAIHQPCWQQAMQEELDALDTNNTWDVVDCPKDVKPIGWKWVYSVKLKSDGSLDRYKARLVALGNRQEYGINYEETFAPVAKMTTVRTVIAIAASQSWPLFQMDVKNAFLHGDLKEEVYMKLPPGVNGHLDKAVCRLKRSLYGLKQAPRAWFDKFRQTMQLTSFVQSQNDPSMFLKRSSYGITILLVYVDDLIITGSDFKGIQEIQGTLSTSFHMKDLGPLQYFLGLEVHTLKNGIFINQQKYAKDLISLARLGNSTSVDTPLEVNVKFRQDDGELLPDPTIYRRLVGSLVYLTITRPDISYAVHLVSQFMSSPRHHHLAAVKRIIRYIHGTTERGLHFSTGSPLVLQGFCDADWAGCPDTRRSTTGWCMYLGNALISWKCKKQNRVSTSSTEAEYRAMSSACSEIIWLRRILLELGFPQTSPTPLHADNTSAIKIAENPVFHERTKHIELDCHFIRNAFEEQTITLPHVPTDLQNADIFTKPLSRLRHQDLVSKLLLIDSPASI